MDASENKWFALGVEALGRCRRQLPPCYVCPLCLRGFESDVIEALTVEHVPPKALGGRPLVLTCLDCNQVASGKDGADTHAKRAENVIDFVRGTMLDFRPARFTVAGVTQEVQLIQNAGGCLVIGVPKAGPPERPCEVEAVFDSLAANPNPGFHINISLYREAYSQRKAAISWLRAGYLTAFAAFGYTYILRRILEPVRAQISSPNKVHVEEFAILDPHADPQARNLILTTEPSWLRALAVQMGRHVVFLPFFDHDTELYARTREHKGGAQEFHFTGQLIAPWPETPVFSCDF